jgi:hypothetical protein
MPPPAPRHCAAKCSSKADAVAHGHATQSPFVVIQAAATFYVYRSAAALDLDAEAFIGHVHIREIVLKERKRRPFVDIDGPVDLHAVVRDILTEFGGKSVLTFRTTRGYHLIVADVMVGVREHARGLAALKVTHPAVDAAAFSSLRFPGTRKPGGPVKEWPAHRRASELLCQPFGAEADAADIYKLGEPVPSDFAAAASKALTGDAQVFALRLGCMGGQLLDRQRAGGCLVCKAHHDRENAYAIRITCGSGLAYCLRNKCTPVPFVFGEDEACGFSRGPGLFVSSTPDEYSSAPLHEGGPGCRPAMGDYVDGSPCGIGKSRAAWSSIPEGASVLCVSYRRAFTAKTAADYGLSTCPDIKFKRHEGQRAIVQLESLPRVDVADGSLDVLLLDEWHGLLRQGWGGLAGVKSRDATARLEELILCARRVIVLDAFANDEDCDVFEKLTGRPFEFVRNMHKPHSGKLVVTHDSHEVLMKNLMLWIATRSPGEKVAVFTHAREKGAYSVEGIATTLQAAGLRVKYYHGKTSQVDRVADFADTSVAYEGVDAVVYNASVEAGVSIELRAFKRLFCFSSRIGAVEVVAQAVNRFRCVTRIDYAGRTTRPATFAPQTEDAVKAAYHRSLRGRQILSTANAPGSSALDSFGGRAWMAVTLEGFRSATHFDARLLAMLTIDGYTVVNGSEPPPSTVLKCDATLVDSFLSAAPAARIASAPILEGEELAHAQSTSTPKTTTEISALDRALFCSRFHVAPSDLTEEMVSAFAGKEAAWYTYRRLLGGYAIGMAPEQLTAKASPTEVLRRVSDLTEGFGFGRIDTLTLVAVAADKFKASQAKHTDAAEVIWKNWGYLFGSDIRRPKKVETTTGAIAMLRNIIGHHYGLRVVSDNVRNPARGSYHITPLEWPSECLKGIPATIAAHRVAMFPPFTPASV